MAEKTRRPGAPSRPPKKLPPLGKALRKLRGTLTLAEAAEKCGTTVAWWHNREIGRNEAAVADLQRIAKAFGVAWRIDGRAVDFFDPSSAARELGRWSEAVRDATGRQ
jgi:transcriptional regulator with XRE-family HTH domain